MPIAAAWRGRRVLLTGHTGFKGGWLATWLQSMGAEVFGFALPPDPGSLGEMLGEAVRGTYGNVRDLASVQAAMAAAWPSVVFHLAAQALVRRAYAEPLETLAANTMGTAHVLDAARRVPCIEAMVIVTTDKVYENREWNRAYRETDALGGHDPYSASKAAAELVTAAWSRSFLAALGVRVASARAGNVVGGGDYAVDRLVPDCLRAFEAGTALHLRRPNATRPWQHVLDPVCGYILLAEALLRGDEAGGAWNFGPDAAEQHEVADVVALMAELWGGGARVSIDAGPHPHEAGLLAVDAAEARTRLGWRPAVPLRQALEWTIHWHRRHRAGALARDLVLADIERITA